MEQTARSKSSPALVRVLAAIAAFAAVTGAMGNAAVQQRKSLRLNIALLAAAQRGDAPAVESLLAQGAEVDTRRLSQPRHISDPFLDLRTRLEYPDYPFQIGYTPLMLACIGGHKQVIRVLLEHGADPNACLCAGEPTRSSTPLSLALTYCHLDSVPLLLAHGVKDDFNRQHLQRWAQFCTDHKYP